MADASQNEFGDFLRSRREKLNPKAVGLPNRQRRRTPGLRREEVAELAVYPARTGTNCQPFRYHD